VHKPVEQAPPPLTELANWSVRIEYPPPMQTSNIVVILQHSPWTLDVPEM
jgi:hypothetical protein